jgi:hypothetical protein
MGSGRDKRKKHEGAGKAAERASRQQAKILKSQKKKAEGTEEEEPDQYNGEESIEMTLQRLKRIGAKIRSTQEQTIEAPMPRISPSILKHPTRDNELVIFGGDYWDGATSHIYDDLLVYNTVKKSWIKIIAGAGPSPRSSVQGITYKHNIIYFGGEFASRSLSQFHHFKDVFRFDTNTYSWTEMKDIKNGPSSRSGHRMCLWKRAGVMFGGFYDNGLETRYHNDLWVLQDLEANGRWTEVQFPTYGERPHIRSGHCLGMYEDTAFVYGGYSTERASRFKKAEATVHHDLWSCNLSGFGDLTVPIVWQRLKMGGIPPPIRSGVSGVAYGKRIIFFGGVVDIDAPGGQTVSSFHNDLFAFHMDSGRFYPLVLQTPKKVKKVEQTKVSKTSNLADELAAMNLKVDSDDSDEEDASVWERKQGASAGATAAALASAPPAATSYVTLPKTGQVLPCARMDAGMCMDGHTLYIIGGLVEAGKKEFTLADMFSLNMNKLETYEVHRSMDMAAVVWKGEDAESDKDDDNASWVSGSTVMTADMMSQLDDDDLAELELEDEEEAIRQAANAGPVDIKAALAGKTAQEDELEMGEDCPVGVPITLADLGQEVGSKTSIVGKKGMKLHRAQLEAQLGAQSAVPTPLSVEEGPRDFYNRTEAFWLAMAVEALFPDHPGGYLKLAPKQHKKCTKEAGMYCRMRYDEAIALMEQLKYVEEQRRVEEEYFKNVREQKRAAEEEREKRMAEETSSGSSDDE